jgi:hypothetical protein
LDITMCAPVIWRIFDNGTTSSLSPMRTDGAAAGTVASGGAAGTGLDDTTAGALVVSASM